MFSDAEAIQLGGQLLDSYARRFGLRPRPVSRSSVPAPALQPNQPDER